MALWQITEFGDRRAFLFLERLEEQFQSREHPGVAAVAVVEKIVGKDMRVGDKRIPFIERYTMPGRMLILGSLVVAVAVFWGVFLAWPFSRIPIWALTILPAIGAGLFLKLGAFLLRESGVPFRADTRD